MNNYFSKFFIFLLLNFSIYSIEERNLYPFYHIKSDSAMIELKNKYVELCRAETKRVFSTRNAKKFECYERNDNLDQIVKKTTEEHNLRKEIKLLFFNKNNKVYKPIFKVDNKEFKLESIIYNKNQKKAYLELTGEGNSYFLFSVDPTKVEFKE